VKLEEILSMWKEDAQVDTVDLDTESLNIPNLHAKWLNILSKERLKLRSLNQKKKKLSKVLAEYYRGDLNNPEDLAEINREPQ
jgi:hypothetical protein